MTLVKYSVVIVVCYSVRVESITQACIPEECSIECSKLVRRVEFFGQRTSIMVSYCLEQVCSRDVVNTSFVNYIIVSIEVLPLS